MADYGDRIQSLMDEVYTECRKEENQKKGKWDVLDGFSEAHQIAVVFGNFNYQVGNGGIEQWIYNGYFHDDGEKLAEYLEIGAETDERCRAILDKVYKLDQYARETDCDRYGNYDDEDGESHFIGEMINSDVFDTWYYNNCGEEDWWKTVCGIIDQAKGRESDIVSQNEQSDGITTAASSPPLQVYIENIHDDSIGGFTMPLPTTRDTLQPFLDGAEIKGWQDMKIRKVISDIGELGEMASESISKTMSHATLDELNYLAAKIDALHPEKYAVFIAVLEAKRHSDSLKELINLTENLDCFDIQPAFGPKDYGAFHINLARDEYARIMENLEQSDNPVERDFFYYIDSIEAHVDLEAYGRAVAEREQGAFTYFGYVTEDDRFKEVYHGPEDIPATHRVSPGFKSTEKAADLIKVCNTDLSAFLLEMHAVGGDYMSDAKHNLQVLAAGGTDFFVMMNSHMLTVTSADLLFRRDTAEHETWMRLNKEPDIRTFVMSVAIRGEEGITGRLCETPLEALQRYLKSHSFCFTHLDAEMMDGSSRCISIDEWNAMERRDRDQMKSWVKHYDPADEESLTVHLDVLRSAVEANRQEVSTDEFLSRINVPFISQAKNPQPGMIRVTLEAAKEILAGSNTQVFRLHKEGAETLSPIDAARIGLWYSFDREFAVRRCDVEGLDRWAKRAAGEILRTQNRDEHIKSHNAEH